MKKIYIILNDKSKTITKEVIKENENYIYNIFYYFKNFDFKMISLNTLVNIPEKRDLIIFNKNYHPLKNKLNEINNITDNFSYLSADKNILFISKNNYKFTDGHLDIINKEKYNIIFDNTTEYNYIIHEDIYDNKDFELNEYGQLCKLIASDNIYNLFNKNISIKLIQECIKHKYVNKKIFHHIIIIDDTNINKIIINKIDINYTRYSIFFMFKYMNYDTEYKIKYIINKLNELKVVFNIYFVKNIINIKNLLDNKLLYFENVVFNNNNFETNNYDKYNEYLKHYSVVIMSDLIITPACIFSKIPISKACNNVDWEPNLNNFIKLIKSFIIHDITFNIQNTNITRLVNISQFKLYLDNIYKQTKVNDLVIPDNYNYMENILFELKDYEQLLSIIDKASIKSYNCAKTNQLTVKKITAAILTQKETILNEQVLSIFKNFNNIEQLIDIEMLISKTKFTKIKKEIYIKIFDKIKDNNQLLLKYLKLSIQSNLTADDIKIIINKINTNKEIFKDINKNNLLLLIIKNVVSIVDNADIINSVNEFIKENYDFIGINSIDGLLELSSKIDINKFMILILLLNTSTKFDNYYETFDDFIKARNQIETNLLYILEKSDMLLSNKNNKLIELNNITYFSVGNFELSYQGIPSANIFKLRSAFFRKVCPELNYKIDTNFINKKIKVLFHASQLTRQHSVYKDRHQVIKHLSLDPRFDVYFSTFDVLNQDVKFSFGNAKHILLTKNLANTRDTFTKMKLDIIVYCEIGMDIISYFMAHMKLAKYQCNTWGHSDTSGIDTIDYFFSSKLYELDYKESQTHYSEKLILQESLCTSYVEPASRHNISLFKSRYHFGFTDECVIYFCVQSLFKFNPLFDEYIINILTNVPNSVILILNNDKKEKFIKRFNNKNITNKMHFFQGMSHFEFLNLMNISDIVLDIYPFGGCNSSFEAFSLNKVIVTQPSIMINGRFTRGFYLKMGLGEYICNTKEEYIEFAIKLAKDKTFRKEIETKITQKKHLLFLDKDTLTEWTDDLIKINNNTI
jgi:predicted O-linked N-acetylglucosamine transferase (SPINDLY family)